MDAVGGGAKHNISLLSFEKKITLRGLKGKPMGEEKRWRTKKKERKLKDRERKGLENTEK